jgi:hypothetical protein
MHKDSEIIYDSWTFLSTITNEKYQKMKKLRRG